MTSQEWWESVRNNQAKLMDWLRKQYHGEAMAETRMKEFLTQFGSQAKNPQWVKTVETIAEQERTHAQWVGELLRVRGEEPAIIDGKKERYWDKTLNQIEDWDTGCAVAAHAEAMRLDRIRVIVADETAPLDIRDVFSRILPQEEFHEKAFKSFSTDAALTATFENHVEGARALGLEA